MAINETKFRASGFLLYLLLALPTLFSVTSRLPLLRGKLGLIDDHEYISFLARAGSGETFGAVLSSTEIGDYPNGERFRPVYYAFRVFEALLFQTEGLFYYGWRLFLLALLMSLLTLLGYWVIRRYSRFGSATSALLASVFGLFYASSSSFDDIVTRLGPSELYALLGAVTMLAGLIFFLRAESKTHLPLITMLLGWIMAAGSKENFLALILLFPLLFLRQGSSSQVRRLALAVTAAGFGFGGFILSGFLPGVLDSDGDVYGQGRDLLATFGAVSVLPKFWLSLFLAIVMFVISFSRVALRSLRLFSVISFTPSIVFLSEAFFYQNELMSFGSFVPARYGALTDLAFLVSLMFALVFVANLLDKNAMETAQKYSTATFVVGLFLFSNPFGFVQDFFLASGKADYLSAQYQQIAQVGGFLSEGQASQTVIIVDEPYDYERLMSVIIFLNYLSSSDTVEHFAVVNIPETNYSPLEQDLARQLQDESLNASAGLGVLPLDQLDTSLPFLCLHFGQAPNPQVCERSVWVGG